MQTETRSWMVEFKNDTAPNYRERFLNEREAMKAAQNFGTTKRKRAYVYDSEGRLFGWQYNGEWHFD